MDEKFIDDLYRKHSKIIFGVRFSKHFFTRWLQRCSYDDFATIIAYVNKNVCMMIYEMKHMGVDNRVYSVDKTIRIVVLLDTDTKSHPTLIVKTVYHGNPQ